MSLRFLQLQKTIEPEILKRPTIDIIITHRRRKKIEEDIIENLS